MLQNMNDVHVHEMYRNLSHLILLEKKIYFHTRKNQQKNTTNKKLCTKGRVKKRQ